MPTLSNEEKLCELSVDLDDSSTDFFARKHVRANKTTLHTAHSYKELHPHTHTQLPVLNTMTDTVTLCVNHFSGNSW